MPDEIIDPAAEPIDENLNGTDDGGGEGNPAEEAKVKIGENEYSPEELTESLKKAKDYDALLPEFTVKSQMLSKLLGDSEKETKQEDLPSFLKEGWKPKNFTELGVALKEAVEWGEKRNTAKQETATKEAEEAKQVVNGFYAEVRKTDKEFNQEDFGEYVKRHSIRIDTVDDLKSVYSTYREANIDGKAAERRALYNKANRAKDSVSKPATGGEKLPFNPQEMRASGRGILDLAREGLQKLSK